MGDLREVDVLDSLDDKLRHPVTPGQMDRLVLVVIDQQNLDLAAITRIDRARRVDDRQSVPQGETRAGMDERRESNWQCQRDPSRDKCSLARCERHVDRGDQVGPRVAGMCVCRERNTRIEPRDTYLGHGREPTCVVGPDAMRQAGTVTTYNERLTAPASWWLGAIAFAVVWGWILLVATTWTTAIITTVLVATLGLFAVWRIGAALVAVEPGGLRAGPAFLDAEHIGTVEPLHREDYRRRLGVDADARAFLVTRPYLDRGVLVHVTDGSDPTPYWLISSRSPQALAAALGHTGPSSEEVPHVQEVQEG